MSEDIINRRAIQWFPAIWPNLRLMETEIRNVDCAFTNSGCAHPAFQPEPGN